MENQKDEGGKSPFSLHVTQHLSDKNHFMTSPKIFCPLFLLAFFSIGCGGPPAGEVTGQVTFNGSPLTSGTITFVPQSAAGVYAHAEVQADGRYAAETDETGKRIPVGQYRVMISAVKDVGPEEPVESLLPLRFSSDTQSKLTADVGEGQNVIDFVLEP